MNKAVKIGLGVAGAGTGLGLFGWWLSEQIDYEPISIKVFTVSDKDITFNVVFSVENPTVFNVAVSKQVYDIYVAGHLISTANATERFRIMKKGTSTLLVNLKINFADIQDKIPAFHGVDLMLLNALQVAVEGRLSAKIGKVLPLFPIPIRSNFTIGDLL